MLKTSIDCPVRRDVLYGNTEKFTSFDYPVRRDEGHGVTRYTMIHEKSPIVWEKRWFVVEVDGDLVKKQFESYFIPDQNGYSVKMGCMRDFVPASKCYESEQAADDKVAELKSLLVVREELAEYAHNCWSHWMRYLFGKGAKNPDWSLTIPREVVERWARQMNTPYQELTEEDRVSDREEAHKILDIVAKSAPPAPST